MTISSAGCFETFSTFQNKSDCNWFNLFGRNAAFFDFFFVFKTHFFLDPFFCRINIETSKKMMKICDTFSFWADSLAIFCMENSIFRLCFECRFQHVFMVDSVATKSISNTKKNYFWACVEWNLYNFLVFIDVFTSFLGII